MTISIFYSDSVYVGEPENAPTRDVQVIVQPCKRTGWAMQLAGDYYVWHGTRWAGTDIFGLWDYLASDGLKKVLFGRTLLAEEYRAVYQRAKIHRDDMKSGFLPENEERHP